jgi:hypothetical protein
MIRKFKIVYGEWNDDGKAYYENTYYYDQLFSKLTIGDIKQYVQEKRCKIHKPVCKCFLSIWKNSENNDNSIDRCYYSDSTYLDDTNFSDLNPIKVIAEKGKKCYCGELKNLKLLSNFEQKREEDNRRWEEKEKRDREFYEKRIKEERDNYENKIDKMQKRLDEQYRENQEQIRAQTMQYQEIINRIQEESKQKFLTIEKERYRERESYAQRFNILEKTLEQKDIQIKINTKKLEENENQKKALKINENAAEQEFISQNFQIYHYYFANNKRLIFKDIEEKIKKIIDEKISLSNINEDIIYKIVKDEKFPKNVKEFLDDKITNLSNENMNITSFNIIILGNTGVGKSTLLNVVLKEKLAETNFGDACTMGVPKPYESDKAKGISIWDSRGIENGKYNLETAFKDIRNTIESLIKENNPDKFIHCIWYCIKSNRFTEEEEINLKNCYNSYIEKLPIIVVFTQSENQKETDRMIEKVRNKIEKAKKLKGINEKEENDIKILKVLAEDYEHDLGIIKSFGIHNLMEQTYESAKIGIERACIHSLMENGKKILKEEFNEIIKKLKEKLYGNINEIKRNNLNKQTNNFLDNILNEEDKKKYILNARNIDNFNYNNFRNFCIIFSREITKNLLLKETISEETTTKIDKAIQCETEKVKQFLGQIFEAQLENISNTLTEKLVDLVAKLEDKYQITKLSSKYHYNELKRQAKNNIIYNFKPELEDNIYREISKILFQKLVDKLSNELLECFNELLKNNKKIKEIFSSKGKENSLICLRNIKKKMDYPSDEYEERNQMKNNKKQKKSKYDNLEDDD